MGIIKINFATPFFSTLPISKIFEFLISDIFSLNVAPKIKIFGDLIFFEILNSLKNNSKNN